MNEDVMVSLLRMAIFPMAQGKNPYLSQEMEGSRWIVRVWHLQKSEMLQRIFAATLP